MLNWKKLFEKYPKAIEKLIRWISEQKEITLANVKEVCEYEGESEWIMSWYYREFYEFFEENSIYINMTIDIFNSGNCFIWSIWWDSNKGTPSYGDNGEYSERKAAEYAAFNKAFEILEEKINGNS